MDTRLWIGKAISDTQMHPSDAYKEKYREELQKVTHLHLPAYHKNVGLYAVILSIARRIGIYEDLIKYLGPENANLVMDYAMYSIVTKSNAVKNLEGEMGRRMLFLGRTYSDSWIDERIKNSITDDQVTAFKDAWLARFKPEDLKDVWVCIDGSNNDCRADIPEAEKGKSKSHINVDIIGFLYAVTQDGTPVTSQVYRGSRVDSKALIWMVNHLNDCKIQPRGVILDRGFCDEASMSLLINKSYEYVIKLKENVHCFQKMLEKYRDQLKFNWKYALGQGMYGVCENMQVFKTSDLKANCALIWDAKNGGMRMDYFVDELLETISNAEASIAAGKKPSIPAKYSQYVQCASEEQKDGSTSWKLTVQDDLIQKDMLEKGYYGLVMSENHSAAEANAIYDLRDSSEKQYAILKSQLGGDVFRAHSMHGIRVREMISFVASVIRNEMLKTCKSAKPKLDVNRTIQELDFITMDRMSSGNYEITPQQSEKQKRIFKLFGITEDNLRYVAAYESRRSRGEIVSPIQSLVDVKKAADKEGKSKTTVVQGLPEGSKAKGKGSRSQNTEQKTEPKESTKEPTASKPKSTPATSSTPDTTAQPQLKPKRAPGRPKGSKNKPKDPNAEPQPKRSPGRPKGSKNKPKQDIQNQTAGKS